MESYKALKQARMDHGFSLDALSAETGIKKRSITYYESGKRQVTGLACSKILDLFAPLEIDPESFYEEHFGYKEECDKKMTAWRSEHPRVLDYASLRHQAYERIAHMKYRKTITDEQYGKLMSFYKDSFGRLSEKLSHKDKKELTDEEYENEYLCFLCNIKSALYLKPDVPEPLKSILLAYFRSEFTAGTFTLLQNDFAALIDYTTITKLRKMLTGELEIDRLPIITALRLCYILNISFTETFGLVKKT